MSVLFVPSIIEPQGASTRLQIVGDIIYTGRAPSGSSTADPVWLITRMDVTEGGEYPELHPDGLVSFVSVWDDRATLTYL